MDEAREIKPQPLGRGLSSLLGPSPYEDDDTDNRVVKVGIHELCPGKYQPRRYLDPESLESLVKSIMEKGVIQPIIVRPTRQALANYEIIAGERRWQAARQAALKEVPVIIRDMSDREALETALIENIQRHDLTPLEEAEGYKRLMDEFNYTQEVLSKVLGKSRSHIANQLRLLNLPQSVKELIEKGLLSSGHAKAIAGNPRAEELAHKIVKQGLNVRQTEKLVQKMNQPRLEKIVVREDENDDIKVLEDKLSQALNMNVQISIGRSEKKITIHFATLDDLELLINRLT
jgi:ParB family chromosome partitioning protein